MTWNDVSVFQWQQLADLFSKATEIEDIDVSVRTASIVTGKTEAQILQTPLSETNKLVDSLLFLKEEIPTKKVKYIYANGKRYRCNYNVKDMPASRYIEVKHFTGDFSNNLHKIAASIVIPQKRSLFGWEDAEYDAKRHEDYSNDLLSASIVDVMSSVVFFYLVYRNWINLSLDSLKLEMKKMGMSQQLIEMTIRTLCDSMDGSIRQSWLQTMKTFRFQMPTNYQLSIS